MTAQQLDLPMEILTIILRLNSPSGTMTLDADLDVNGSLRLAMEP
jgi:hypothetical protein